MSKKIVCPNCLTSFDISYGIDTEKKTEVLRIRCKKSTLDTFKEIANNYSTLEDALLALISDTIDVKFVTAEPPKLD